MKSNLKRNFNLNNRRINYGSTYLAFERLEERTVLAGHGVAFFVNGFTGAQIPVDVQKHLVDDLVARSNVSWDKDNDGFLDVYTTNWNSPDPKFESGDPGKLVGTDIGFGFSATVANTLLFGVPIPFGINIDPIVKGNPVTPDAFIDAVTQILNTEYDDNDFVVLIGHSLGGNSILEIANRTSRQIDLLATLDPVGFTNTPDDAASQNLVLFDGYSVDKPKFLGGGSVEILPKISVNIPSDELTNVVSGDFHDPVRGTPGYRKDLPQPSKGNVGYLYNRWQEKFLFPIDRARSGFLTNVNTQHNVSRFSINGSPIAPQEEASTQLDANGTARLRFAGPLDVLFGYSHLDVNLPNVDFGSISDPKFPPEVSGGSVGFSKVSVQNHSSLPLDQLINKQINAILDRIVPQPPKANAGSDLVGNEGDLFTLNGNLSSDPNPDDVLTYSWVQISGPFSVSIASSTTATPTFRPTDNGRFVFRLIASDGTSSDTDDVVVVVRNVAPIVTPVSGPNEYVRGFKVDYSSSFTDPGTRDTHALGWNFGDGTSVVFTAAAGQGSISQGHNFKNAGTYDVDVTVRDDDGGVGSSLKKTVKILVAGLVPNKSDPTKKDLLVGGSIHNDLITILPAPGNGVQVIVVGELDQIFFPTGEIQIAAQDGNDNIVVNAGLPLPVIVNGGIDDDNIDIEGASAISPVTVNGDEGNDVITISNNSGKLTDIKGTVSADGGDGSNALAIYDNNNEVGGVYGVTPLMVDKGASRIVYSSIGELSVSASKAADEFRVEPSPDTHYQIDGNGPNAVSGAIKQRDSLHISLAATPRNGNTRVTNPKVTFNAIVLGRQESGVWKFGSPFRDVDFSGFEHFNLIDKLVTSSDAAWVASAGVEVSSPVLNSSYSKLVTNFTASNLAPFSLSQFPSPELIGKTVLTNLLLPADVNGSGDVSPLDALLVINYLNRNSMIGSGVASTGFLDVNNDGNISPLDALLIINTLNHEARPAITFGGVRTAVADLNFDGVDEVIAVSGANHIPTLLVFNGVTGQLMGSPQPLTTTTDNFGTNVAAGDIDGDGKVEIITSSDRGPGTYAIWRWENGLITKIADRNVAFSAGYLGGVRVATGDLNGDGKSEIIVGSGTGTDASVRAYDANGIQLSSFLVATSFGRGGVYVATGDYNGDGRSDLFVSSGRRGNAQIQVFDGFASLGSSIASSRLISNAYTGQDALAPISIALKDSDGDEEKELYSSQLSDGRSDQLKKWEFSEAADAFFSTLQSDLDPDWSSGAFLG